MTKLAEQWVPIESAPEHLSPFIPTRAAALRMYRDSDTREELLEAGVIRRVACSWFINVPAFLAHYGVIPSDLQPLSQLAVEVFHIQPQSLHRARSKGRYQLRTYRRGREMWASRSEAEAMASR